MKFSIHLLVIFTLISNIPTIIQAKEITHNHNSVIKSEIKKKVGLKVYILKQVPANCTLEIKHILGKKKKISPILDCII